MNESKPLAGSVALVTGASRGIGAALAVQLAQAGAHIVAVARTVGGLEELDDKIQAAGSSATLVPLDVKDSDGIARLALALNERYQKLDVLVGNAGILGVLSPLGHVEPKAWNDILAVNVTANWQLIRTMDPLLKRAAAGRAVFITSGLGWLAKPYCGPYAVTKAGLNMLARTYANECASSNVRVNLYNPGPTATRMYKSGWPGVDQSTLPSAEEVAAAIVPLCTAACEENGKIYQFAEKKFLEFHMPS